MPVPTFAAPLGEELWVLLLEKVGSFSSLSGGFFFCWIKIFLLLDQVEAKQIFPGPKKSLKSFTLSFLKPKQTAKEEFGLEEFCSLPAVSNDI